MSVEDAAQIFLSTPSARRATILNATAPEVLAISIHALREEGDRPFGTSTLVVNAISIHALREEGDFFPKRAASSSTISIHALREEGDEMLPGLAVAK